MEKYFQAAKAVALASPGTGQRQGFRVGAVLIDKKQIVTARFNSYKTHPLLTKYTNWPFQHAESACVIAHGLDNCSGLDLLVTRVDKKGVPTMSKPCDCCTSLMADVHIRRAYYTNWEGKLECLQIS